MDGWEPEEILEARPIRLTPGDAVVRLQRTRGLQAANPDTPYGRPFGPPLVARDSRLVPAISSETTTSRCSSGTCSTRAPIEYDIAWGVHSAIFAYGSRS